MEDPHIHPPCLHRGTEAIGRLHVPGLTLDHLTWLGKLIFQTNAVLGKIVARSKNAFFDVVLRWFCFKTENAAIPWSMVSQQKGYCSRTPPKQNTPFLILHNTGISDPSWHIPTPQYKTKRSQKADHGTTTLQCCRCCLLPEQHTPKNCKIFQIYRIGGSLRITSAPA